MAHEQINGSCLCGLVTFNVRGPFQSFYYCHCNRCQKATGSTHGANIFAHLDSVNWMTGKKHIQTFQLSDTNNFNAAFCKKCGCPVPRVSTTGNFIIIPAGCLDDDPRIKPNKSIFWDSRAIWDESVKPNYR